MPVAAGATVLLTGATGFLGKVVLDELLRRWSELGVARVLALLRAPDAEAADARFRTEVAGSRCFAAHAPGWEKAVEPLAGDLTRPDAGLGREALERVRAEATHVVHCAASVEFNLPLAEATAANATGALRALELAQACEAASFVHVSTAFVRPHDAPASRAPCVALEAPVPLPYDPERLYAAIRRGEVTERRLLAETGHPNTYTLTKCLAEHLVARRAGALPTTFLRPSIIAASTRHPEPGWIDSPAAFAAVVMMIGAGGLRVVAADPATRVDLVPCDEVARRAVDAAFAPPPAADDLGPRILHAVSGLESACSIARCRAQILRYFEAHRVGLGPRLAWVGREGVRFRAAHTLRHELPLGGAALALTLAGRRRRARRARRLLARQRTLHRDFAYFTHRTFDFRSSEPLDPPLDPDRYLETVCRGVHHHLLGGDGGSSSLVG